MEDKLTQEEKKENAELLHFNKKIINGMFSGNLLDEFKTKDISKYYKELAELLNDTPKRYLYAHSTIANAIGIYFDFIGWEYGFEIPLGDLDSNYRFDLMGQKGAKTIVVEVKPTISTRDLGQVLGYVFDVKKKMKKARVFLGTDILNMGVILNGGEITDIIDDNAEKHGLGVFLATKDFAYILPAEFLTA